MLALSFHLLGLCCVWHWVSWASATPGVLLEAGCLPEMLPVLVATTVSVCGLCHGFKNNLCVQWGLQHPSFLVRNLLNYLISSFLPTGSWRAWRGMRLSSTQLKPRSWPTGSGP